MCNEDIYFEIYYLKYFYGEVGKYELRAGKINLAPSGQNPSSSSANYTRQTSKNGVKIEN